MAVEAEYNTATHTGTFKHRMKQAIQDSDISGSTHIMKIVSTSDLLQPSSSMSGKRTLHLHISHDWCKSLPIWSVNIKLLKVRLEQDLVNVDRVDLFGMCLPSVVALLCSLPRLRCLNLAPSFPLSGVVLKSLSNCRTLRTLKLNMMPTAALPNPKQALTLFADDDRTEVDTICLFNCHSMIKDEHTPLFRLPSLHHFYIRDHGNMLLCQETDDRWVFSTSTDILPYTASVSPEGAMFVSIRLDRKATPVCPATLQCVAAVMGVSR